MNKKTISSLELAAIINELQFLVKERLLQIYTQDKEFILQISSKEKGKQYLKIVPGKLLNLTKEKDVPIKPSSFCMQLRKYLANATIKSIAQKDTERIIIFELEKKERYYLIVELYSKGNLLFTDEDFNVLGALEQQTWKDRAIKVKEKYEFPKSNINWKNLSSKELESIIKKSDKKNIVISLATDIGLGGVYAEEICSVANIDKNILPKEVSEVEVKQIIKTLKDFLENIKKPQGYIYENEITPFPLSGRKPGKITESYNEAVSTLNLYQKASPYEKRISVLKRTIADQEEAIKNQESKIELYKRKGEMIYEKYQSLQKLLEIVKELKKNKSWKEISEELKKEKKISKIDLENKKITINL